MKKHGRTKITCKLCLKVKLHYGLGMCSSCLRHHKRRTRPRFYLGTQYSEIKRRCTHPNVDGRNYQGKYFCSKEEFIGKFLNNPEFLNQYELWQKSGFQRKESPSIDRIDNDGDYRIDNLQILRHSDNSAKDCRIPIKVYRNSVFIKEFKSRIEAARYIGVSAPYLCRLLKKQILSWNEWSFEYV